MDRDFLEKRKKDLNAYLQVTVLHVSDLSNIECLYCLASFVLQLLRVFQLLLNPEMVKACPTLIPYVYDFLENKAYSKGKGEFARKVKTFFYINTCLSLIYLLPDNCKYIMRLVKIFIFSPFCFIPPSDRHIC